MLVFGDRSTSSINSPRSFPLSIICVFPYIAFFYLFRPFPVVFSQTPLLQNFIPSVLTGITLLLYTLLNFYPVPLGTTMDTFLERSNSRVVLVFESSSCTRCVTRSSFLRSTDSTQLSLLKFFDFSHLTNYILDIRETENLRKSPKHYNRLI